MIITSIKIFSYQLPLALPLSVFGKKLDQREGLVVQLSCDDGSAGFGEIAPLFGASKETMDEALKQTLILRERLWETDLPEDADQLDGKLAEWLNDDKLFSSVRFGFEMAALTLLANQDHISLASLLKLNHDKRVPLNGLLHGKTEAIFEQAKIMKDARYQSVKLKVGGNDIQAEIAKTNAVMNIFENSVLLRLDANRNWSFDQAMQFAEELGPAVIEYIEEPFKDVDKIPEFYNKTLIPVALDESIPELSFDKIKGVDGLEILILKPTILGGFERTWALLNSAKAAGIRCIISSCFESGLGIDALANFSAAASQGIPMGLDTLRWFKDDIVDIAPVKNGYYYLPDTPVHDSLKFDRVKELT